MAWSTSAFFGVQDLQATSPLDASKGCDGENGRMVQSFMTKSQQKIAGFWGGSYLTVKGANLYV